MIALAYVIFTLSGAAGLMYESVWSRYLALFVGHSAYAQVLVLAIFLGGMAIGAAIAARHSERFRDPLLLYAGAELLVAVIGFGFHALFTATTAFAYGVLFPAVGPGFVLSGIKWTLSALLILPQAILLGTTFPLMAAAVIRRLPRAPGHVLGLLYFTNNIGAAIGVLVAGFVLLAAWGLPGTITTAAVINVIVAAIAAVLAKLMPAEHGLAIDAALPADAPAHAPETERMRLRRLLFIVAFGTAVASFGYEIGWIRMLSLVLGSATHSFEIMLSAFIFGMAIGALWIRRHADRFTSPLRALGIVQWVMGFAALATLPLYGWTFDWIAWLMQAFTRSEAGYAGFGAGKYAASLAVMLPSTICAGMTLPLLTRLLVVSGEGEKGIGEVYSVNTVGAIIGVAIAGLVAMPLLGVRTLIIVSAALDMALGVVVLVYAGSLSVSRRRFGYGSAAVAATAVAAMLVADGVDPGVLSGGVFRYGTPRPPWLAEVPYYRDGRTATISVYRTSEPERLVIATNGKPDGSVPLRWLEPCSIGGPRDMLAGDISTQTLGPLISLAHAPRARRAAVIGHGTGISGHILLGHGGLEEVVTIEIEPEIIRGSAQLYPANALVFDDPRSHIVIEDARTHFAAGHEPYDVIVATPSNPWVSGVASLFTTEFYGHVKRHLSDDGVFGQWFQMYEMNDELVMTVLAAIHRQFANFVVFQSSSGDLLVVATKADTLPTPDWNLLSQPSVRAALCHARPLTSADLEAARVSDARALAPALERWTQPNSDFYPVLELGAERARYAEAQADGFLGMTTEGFDIGSVLSDRPLGPTPDVRLPSTNIGRLVVRSEAAFLRTLDSAPVPIEQWPNDLRSARYYHERWHDMIRGASPQHDWYYWLEQYRNVHADRSAGIAGDADRRFFAAVHPYLDRVAAPPTVRSIVELDEALDGWDFTRASTIIDALFNDRSLRGLSEWIPARVLAENGVIAKLKVNDVAGARALYEAMADAYDRPPLHLRRLLIEAHLAAAERR